ncbi:hypothetical protein XENOCAPTIV_029663 [Xenoophorus captivus]|uniref:Uncharacterized protein n=1 Tax=Xenoophorus captivus TaxID=1517983 RepID=A0ABV0SC27_9TELE
MLPCTAVNSRETLEPDKETSTLLNPKSFIFHLVIDHLLLPSNNPLVDLLSINGSKQLKTRQQREEVCFLPGNVDKTSKRLRVVNDEQRAGGRIRLTPSILSGFLSFFSALLAFGQFLRAELRDQILKLL